ncbi:hypothetical protein G6F56_002856 [Rhizopus delemar]|uniref:Adenosine deaminase domain-containing protein n=1 Tax=Rhizopus stolonifer TaxID=4846 RepID=A0A367KLN7_RHIST|nr:hypothetical protein G6F56_002856 [Rhizopus delemar]RCI03133.1 hypothetical protein CU098_007881 [Rhizopus stolonifer]
MTSLKDFCFRLPKVELHAHLNGSISPATMKELVERKKETKPKLSEFKIPENLDADSFFPLFGFIYELTDDEESVKIATRNIIDEFARDNVRYLELRTTPRSNAETGMTKTSYLEAVTSVIQEPRKDITVRLIVSADRRNTLEEAEEVIDLAVAFRSKGVVGIDLCGDVKQGSFENLKPAFDRAKFLEFPVTLHFNEVIENLPEGPAMLAFRPNRLGHATILDEYCRKTIYENHVPIEICMTSNVLCKTAKSYEQHHIKELIDHGHPFVLSTDDKGVFFSDLSNEYRIAGETFNLTISELFNTSYHAIDAIFGGDKIKAELQNIWLAFKQKCIEEF